MNLDKRLVEKIKNAKGPFVLTVLLNIIAAFLIIIQARLISDIINSVFLQKKSLADVFSHLILFLVISMARSGFQWGSQHFSGVVAAKIKIFFHNQLLVKIQQSGPTFTSSKLSGKLYNTLLSGIDALDTYFSQYLPGLLQAVLIPILILFFIFPVDLLSGIVLLLTAPLIPFFMKLIGSIAQSLTKKQWSHLNRMSEYYLDVLQGLTTLKIFGKSHEQIQKISQIAQRFRKSTMNVLRVAFLSALTLEWLATISTAIIAVEIGLRLLYHKMDFQSALFILLLAPEFYLPLRQLGARFHSGITGTTAALDIYEILDAPVNITISQNHTLDSFKKIQFNNVTFKYPNTDKPALSDITFQMDSGSTIVLIGPSGAGKSTLMSLLLKFMPPTTGDIYIDDKLLEQFNSENWRNQIAWVPQQPYLFHSSLMNNIRIADPKASQEQVEQAIEHAHLTEFVSTLADGYNTIIGERGERLSGGQAQRLALARAFLKDAPLLILDEPTAHLDPVLDEKLTDSLKRLTQDKTALVTAHRFSTVFQADQVLVLENGFLTEAGQPSALNQSGHFLYDMVNLQKGRDV